MSVIVGFLAAAGLTVGSASASQAAASVSPEAACGSGYSRVSDGTREIKSGSAVYGRAYLLYNNSTGKNCLAVIKSANTRVSTYVKATLTVQGSGGKSVSGNAKSYVTVTRLATGKCVMYSGEIHNVGGTKAARGGRSYWGNCG
ncbi:hypothetical protein [Nonomuraea rubra]|uniref:Spore-associated protein A n=1 Tax=Nonomuraea rubra TaxID=46180 RepID=A0A7X0NP38_9ACTN|nr:hypothetical protein [Nonomuraea rubra]MBB6546934.1 hypothetical protein [Nonomuraea rubra]